MKLTLSLFTVALLLTACRPKDSADDKMQKELSGTWTFEARYKSGGSVEQSMTLARDGSYVLTLTMPGRTNGPRTISMEGTFRVEGGFLVDTVTKDSQTNAAPMPRTNRARIVRLDGRELVLDDERSPAAVYPTNQVVFLKQTK